MIIKKLTQPINCEIYKTEGHGAKEKKIKLYAISVPQQSLVYSLGDDAFDDRGLEIEVQMFADNSPQPESAEGKWQIDTFSRFVEGVKEVTEVAFPYLSNNLNFFAEAYITETTHVWSTVAPEEVGGGFFKKGETQLFQRVRLQILGLSSGWVRWEPALLDPVIRLRDNFIQQRDLFVQEVRAIRQSQAA